ncbi:RNA polymerase sigma factor sigF, chloroplastic [Vitis vinifera]|uniref:RNA polymerase sigma factor sigF, chloroplastic n=1 Tax=Vitis vinifera TaxID=29760 RepID=A0A438D3T8_VITVI|nr:RNA polymerase sigma factor sigF, chloroplastic [Vitis vinifera]
MYSYSSMEAGTNILSSTPSFPPRTHFRNSSSSVLMLHDQVAPAVASIPTTIARKFPTSVLLQEQRDEYRPFPQALKDERTFQATLEKRQMEIVVSADEENSDDHDQYMIAILPTGEKSPFSSSIMKSITTDIENSMDVKPCDVLALAKKALSASKQAVSLYENAKLLGADLEDSPSPRAEVQRKINEGYDPKDPLRLFLWGPETRKLLTAKEESELIVQIQELMRLEEVKKRLQSHLKREPTVVEWAEAVGLSCQVLQSQLHSGNRSRQKLIYANLRMVVHIAKQYQGRGLNLQDLLQEGSMGLMNSVEKFKPNAGCRFASYAYWWIRQAVRKAIFQHSRTIRLPENMYSLLGKVKEAKRLFIQEGHHDPTKEEIAERVGITIEKLQRLLLHTRMPLSMQQPVWADQDTTFQEVTADTGIEIPDVSVAKQLMRQHVRNLLHVLTPKERRIIRLRFGIGDGIPRTLSEIGLVFGFSKERVRQLEQRALHKLKQCLSSHGLESYTDLLV